MKYYPILLSVRDPIIGQGFLASVSIHGRALLRDDGEEGFWVDGVFPGALCASGDTKDEALFKFREAYQEILRDIASEAASFTEFQERVERFFWEQTPGELEAWQDAAGALRANADGAGDWLPIRKNHPEPSIQVECLVQEDLAPTRNADESVELAAAPQTRDRPAA